MFAPIVRTFQLILWLISFHGVESFVIGSAIVTQHHVSFLGNYCSSHSTSYKVPSNYQITDKCTSFQRCIWLKSTSCDRESDIADLTDVGASVFSTDSKDTYSAGDKNMKKRETLRFGGEYSYTSPTYSLSKVNSDHGSLYNFLNSETIQHLLLSGGTNSTVQKIPNENLDINLVSKWIEQVEIMKGSKPDIETDSIVKVTPPGIDIVTVSIIPTTTIGTKLLKVEHSDGLILPEFQATLIEDEPRAVGPKFFVWLFNKITFGGDPDETNQDTDNNSRKENAFLRFHVEMIESEQDDSLSKLDGNEDKKFVFIAESSMWLEFEFPRLLLRFFPMKKDKAEALCSNAILKALEKNMLPAMDAFCKEYEKFVQ